MHDPEEAAAPVRTGGPPLDVPAPVLHNHWFEARSQESRKGFEGWTPKDVWEWFQDPPHAERQLDLHGYTRAEAFDTLNNFLARSLENRCSWVRVIHGRGEGILRVSVRGWLGSCGYVASYIEEKSRHQSLLVELRRLWPMQSG